MHGVLCDWNGREARRTCLSFSGTEHPISHSGGAAAALAGRNPKRHGCYRVVGFPRCPVQFYKMFIGQCSGRGCGVSVIIQGRRLHSLLCASSVCLRPAPAHLRCLSWRAASEDVFPAAFGSTQCRPPLVVLLMLYPLLNDKIEQYRSR
jgi:hypothetical protein